MLFRSTGELGSDTLIMRAGFRIFMSDLNHRRLAELATGYCIEVNEGETVGIQAPTVAEPLVAEMYSEIIKKGAHCHVMMTFSDKEEIFYSLAADDQLTHVSPFSKYEIENLDRIIQVFSSTNLKELSSVDPQSQAKRNAAHGPLFELFKDRFVSENGRLVILPYPTPSMAQEAEMGAREYADFVYSACHVDQPDPIESWKEVSRRQDEIVARLNNIREMRFVNEVTDLSVSLEGRTWMNCDGHINMPDGEVCTSPVEDSVEGEIGFTYPGIFQGREVRGVRLEFEKGNVTQSSATKGQDLLEAILTVDEGAKRVGEVAIGTNEQIDRFTKNILFDEKLGHTMHLAIGGSLPMCGGENKSGIHWDLITDMKNGGKVYGDGELIYSDGKFLI
jgi:aminopeptidase